MSIEADKTALRHRMRQHHHRIGAHDPACVIGVTVTGPGLPRRDKAHHRAGIAADLSRRGGGSVRHDLPP